MRPEHHFNPDLADRYGVDVAIILHEIAYYVDYNRRNGVNFHEGRWWMFNTLQSFCESHTYWTKNQVEYLLRKCKNKGLILTGHFHEGGNRTTWYTVSDEIAAFFRNGTGLSTNSENSEMGMELSWTLNYQESNVFQTWHAPSAEFSVFFGHSLNLSTSSEFSEINSTHFVIFRNPFLNFQKSIYNEENNIQENNIHTPKAPQGGRRRRKPKQEPEWKPERFAKFWDFYRENVRPEDRLAAVRAWDKLKPDDALIERIGKALMVQIESPSWKEGYGKPYASTYLNNERWTDVSQMPRRSTAQSSGGWAPDKEVL